MRVVLLLSLYVAATQALPKPEDVLGGSKCFYLEASDTVDCSTVSDPEEIVSALQELSNSGLTSFTNFVLVGNANIYHLPQTMLGDVKFNVISITNNTNLSSVSDILGASKSSAVEIDLSWNHLSYLPRIECSSLKTFKINGPYMSSIAVSALNAVPNVETIELQQAGYASNGLVIADGVFTNLPSLQTLNLQGYYPKDYKATKGSFNFVSADLRTVNLISSAPIYTAEEGTFVGFNSMTTLSLLLHAPIDIPSFYGVFNSGSTVVVQEPQPCGCNLDWIRYSCFLPQASIRCVYRNDYYDLADVPDDNFSSCCFGKTL